jgi:putative DNA primase/helicase
MRFGSKGSVSLKIGTGQFYDHEQAEGGGVLWLIARERGLKGKAAFDWLRSLGCRVDEPAPSPRPARSAPPRDPAANKGRALAIWHASESPTGTPVERYLERRGVLGPARAAFDHSIRFHPTCPFGATHVPAMVCLVRAVADNEPQAIHRTALSPEGEKIEIDGKSRAALGPVAGGAVKLSLDEDPSCLGIGEGVESTLSLQLVADLGARPVWSLLSSGGLSSLPVLGGVECLWVAVDNDAAGREAAETCSLRWGAAGKEVVLVTPQEARADLNDILRQGGARHG